MIENSKSDKFLKYVNYKIFKKIKNFLKFNNFFVFINKKKQVKNLLCLIYFTLKKKIFKLNFKKKQIENKIFLINKNVNFEKSIVKTDTSNDLPKKKSTNKNIFSTNQNDLIEFKSQDNKNESQVKNQSSNYDLEIYQSNINKSDTKFRKTCGDFLINEFDSNLNMKKNNNFKVFCSKNNNDVKFQFNINTSFLYKNDTENYLHEKVKKKNNFKTDFGNDTLNFKHENIKIKNLILEKEVNNFQTSDKKNIKIQSLNSNSSIKKTKKNSFFNFDSNILNMSSSDETRFFKNKKLLETIKIGKVKNFISLFEKDCNSTLG